MEKQKEFKNIIQDNMLEYGLASMARALPNNIDGLKLTQRRVLYAMYKRDKVDGKFHFQKSVRIVGNATEFIGTGDASIYQAMVYMGQKDRHINPLVASKGNFGYITDSLSNFAASRYTQAHLSEYAYDFYFTDDLPFSVWKENYLQTTEEPIVLPTLLPMGLVQGSKGIAYTASNTVIPMGLHEVAKAYVEYLKILKTKKPIKPEEEKRILGYLKFKTANKCKIPEHTPNLFHLGQGRVVMKGEYVVERASHGRDKIVITSLPYLVETPKFTEEIKNSPNEVSSCISELSDESSADGVRISIVLKKGSNTNIITDWLNSNNNFNSKRLSVYKYFSFKWNRVVKYNIMKLFEEHAEFKINTLRNYFEYLIEEYQNKLKYLEALLYIIEDRNRTDEFLNILTKSDKDTYIDKLKKKFKFEDKILEYICSRNFKVFLKNKEDIKIQIKELKEKLKEAEKNKRNRIDYLINEIETKVKKYKR